MLFTDIDDTSQTMDSILSRITDPDDEIFGSLSGWKDFLKPIPKTLNAF